MKVLIIGGSGLVGGRLLDLLAGSTEHEIKCLLRHPVNERKGIKQRVATVGDWLSHAADFGPDVLISTLGTTIAQAGSKAAFAAVDKDLVLAVADAARGSGARQCITVSSVGAAAVSGTFYLRTKGEIEAALAAAGFDRLDILRPGLLLGERGGPARPMERLGMALAPITNLLTPRVFDRYQAIRATAVAAAIAALVGAQPSGHFIHHNREMLALAD
jgi:uncharacterized protein YbjT (DUF2867 family)